MLRKHGTSFRCLARSRIELDNGPTTAVQEILAPSFSEHGDRAISSAVARCHLSDSKCFEGLDCYSYAALGVVQEMKTFLAGQGNLPAIGNQLKFEEKRYGNYDTDNPFHAPPE